MYSIRKKVDKIDNDLNDMYHDNLINDDYTIEDLKNDFYAYFEPDDRGDINR